MSDLEKKSVPPIVISQHEPTSPLSPNQIPSHKEFWSPTETSPASSRETDSDDDNRALTVTVTNTSRLSATRQPTRITTHGTDFTLDPDFEVDFEPDDPDNPRNKSIWFKAYALFTISFGTLGVVMYSTSYTASMTAMMKEFGVNSEPIATLGVTAYLLGLAVGSLLLAPIAETYGRKPVYTVCMAIYVILVLPAALARDLPSVIIVRFFGAVFGSAMIANAPGSIADLVSDEYRATAFSIWSIGPMNGPVIGPTIGGFVTEYLGWRWTNWIVMIWGGTALFLLLFLKETYAPVLLQRKAKKARKDNDDERYWSRYDIRVGFWELMRINLRRPFVMALTEPICIFWNVYISICYGEHFKPEVPHSCTDLLQASSICASLPTQSSSPNIVAGQLAYPASPS
jgi:multidrug resistance protein